MFLKALSEISSHSCNTWQATICTSSESKSVSKKLVSQYQPQGFERKNGGDHEQKTEERERKKWVGDLTLDDGKIVGNWLQGHEDSKAGHVVAGTRHLTPT
jgi:hypothetical protein